MYYLQIIIGASLLLLIGAVFSNNAKKINPKYLFNAILLQFVLAILLIKVPFITAFFESISQGVLALKAHRSRHWICFWLPCRWYTKTL
jgi:CNT family concentrative nucleoside transporter